MATGSIIQTPKPPRWWWNVFRWIADSFFVQCNPMILPLLPAWAHRSTVGPPVTGTILCPAAAGGGGGGDNSNNNKKKRKQVKLCFQEGGPAGPPILILDLPIGDCQLDGECRIVLECEGAQAGGGPLLGAPMWTVYFNGKKVGFGWRREAEDNNVGWALESIRAVSAGVGLLPQPKRTSGGGGSSGGGGGGGGGGRYEYLRGTFERVVGSADSESYHLVDPSGCLGQELSFFFIRL